MSTTPIADHALLSDCHSSALVDRTGSVVWLTFPRFDSPAVFAGLLDDTAGHWSIRPVGEFTSTRRYRDDSLVLETSFTTASGAMRVVDALALGDGGPHALGKSSPHLLVREVVCEQGQVDIELDYAPRPEYGLIRPLLSHVNGGVAARGGSEWLVLSTPVRPTITGSTATARWTIRAGESLRFALHRSTLEETPARVWTQPQLGSALAHTEQAWREWSQEHQNYDGPWAELVRHSGRVLQALTFRPSGAIVAAPTTSLPEGVGGERNWDYRYTWVRDASFTVNALWVAACPDEASDFFAFMATAAAGSLTDGDDLQIMFGVGGEHDLSERTLRHLTGWRDSRPVRVGNGAWEQRQVDVYGELLDAAYRMREQLGALDDETKTFLIACADAATRRWLDQDQGIWEVRGEPRHFLYSKVMCWVALDRAIRMADLLSAGHRVSDWTRVRDEICSAVLTRGWSDEANSFVQYFGGTDLDASNLMLPITGFIEATDPRMLATIDAVAERLTDERGLVYRYRAQAGVDGLAGEEGTFLLCTFWLAEAQARAGHVEDATATFERAVAFANDLGLLAEEVDESTGELLGNFPQAFSHIGLVNAAWAISRARVTATV